MHNNNGGARATSEERERGSSSRVTRLCVVTACDARSGAGCGDGNISLVLFEPKLTREDAKMNEGQNGLQGLTPPHQGLCRTKLILKYPAVVGPGKKSGQWGISLGNA